MNKNIVLGSLLLAVPMTTLAEGSPWLVSPGNTVVQLSSIEQEGDEFWAGDNRGDTPGNGDVSLSTILLSVSHGISDNLAADFKIGYSESDTAVAPEEKDIGDATVGLTWRIHDEFISSSNAPSVALRVAATIKGSYETSTISAIGDGANGVEASLLVGKVFDNGFALAGDVGYRYREGDVDNETIVNLSASYLLSHNLSATLGYHMVDSQGNLDIGGPGFSPQRFDEVEEDVESIDLSLSYALTPLVNLSVSYGSVIDGRNTVKSDIVTAGIGFSF